MADRAVQADDAGLAPRAARIELINLDPETPRSVVVQAGTFAEHTIGEVSHDLPPSSRIRLSLDLSLRTRTPYRTPFDAREEGP